ncbi:MAG TPA: hypothetical protein VK066_20735 [Chloroflexota bacterium]|nr:hypothetical protein [Chloroflexota bacterium]
MTLANFTTWFAEATYRRRGSTLEVVVPARFVAEHLQTRMRSLILRLAAQLAPEISAVRVMAAPKAAAATQTA